MTKFLRAGLVLLGGLFLQVADCKLGVGSVLLGSGEGAEAWHYIGKFGFEVGSGSYEIRGRAHVKGALVNTSLQIFTDDEWARVAHLPPCARAAQVSKERQSTLIIRETWKQLMRGKLAQVVRPRIWYFALARCGREDVPSRVDYDVRFRQADGSELSVELRLMPWTTLLAVMWLSAFLLRFVIKVNNFRRSAGVLPPVVVILAASVILQWIGQSLHLLHLHQFERQGTGESIAEISADIFFVLSQIVSCTLFIVIAQGYTLMKSRPGQLRFVATMATLVAVLQVALILRREFQGELAERHHGHEGAFGWTALVVRVLIFLWFEVSCKSLKEQTGGCSFRLHPFIRQFQFAGSLYLLSYPITFLLASVFAPYIRHPIMHLGLVAFQMMSAQWISNLFLSRGAYFQVSTLSSSLLPGASPTSCPDGSIRCDWKLD